MNAVVPRAGANSLAPTTWQEARQFADLLAQSDMVPRDFKGKPANVMVAVQWGAELGLGPLQAVQNIAVINGKPSIYGDAALALVRGHPACEWVREGVEGEGDARHGFCEIKRARAPQPERRTFSVADAKRAGLWGKSGPWQQYPDRMLQMRARGFAIRDVFPDALRGVITAEEAEDTPAEPRHVPNLDTPRKPAPAGSMRAEAEAIQAEPRFPVIAPNGQLAAIRGPKWIEAIGRALGGMENAEALSLWRAEMGAHLASMAEAGHHEMVEEAERLMDLRRDELAEVVA